MRTTVTSTRKYIFQLLEPILPKQGHSTGFTLPELLVASLVLGLVITLAGTGLVWVLKANEKNTIEAERQAELNRALNFIADEIKSAKTVSITGIPNRAGYLGVLRLTRDINGTEKEFAYYTAPKSESPIWRGPRTVYRQQINPPIGGPSTYALVDAISDVDPNCTGSGNSPSSNKGLKVFVQDNAYVKLCLVGQLSDSKTLLLESQVFRRGATSP